MAIAVWPEYADVVVENYRTSVDSDVARTEFDSGATRQAVIRHAALTTRTLVVLLADDADYVRFRAWAAAAAARWFVWVDPEDAVARQVRVRGGQGGISYTARMGGGSVRRWEARCTLEGPAGRTLEGPAGQPAGQTA